MIEGEERYHAKLLSLLRITKFAIKELNTLSSSLNLEYKILIKETIANCLTKNGYNKKKKTITFTTQPVLMNHQIG